MFNPDDYANDVNDAYGDDILDVDGPSDEEVEAMYDRDEQARQEALDDLDEEELGLDYGVYDAFFLPMCEGDF